MHRLRSYSVERLAIRSRFLQVQRSVSVPYAQKAFFPNWSYGHPKDVLDAHEHPLDPRLESIDEHFKAVCFSGGTILIKQKSPGNEAASVQKQKSWVKSQMGSSRSARDATESYSEEPNK